MPSVRAVMAYIQGCSDSRGELCIDALSPFLIFLLLFISSGRTIGSASPWIYRTRVKYLRFGSTTYRKINLPSDYFVFYLVTIIFIITSYPTTTNLIMKGP